MSALSTDLVSILAVAFRPIPTPYTCMQRLPPFRDRTALELRAQAKGWRDAAETEPSTATLLLRLARRYEAIAAEREAATRGC